MQANLNPQIGNNEYQEQLPVPFKTTNMAQDLFMWTDSEGFHPSFHRHICFVLSGSLEVDIQDVDGSVAITPTLKQRRDLLQVCIYCHIIVMYVLFFFWIDR